MWFYSRTYDSDPWHLFLIDTSLRDRAEKTLLEEGMQLFNKADECAKLIAEHEEKQRVLYETVGQLTIERDYLKKCWSKLHGSSNSN